MQQIKKLINIFKKSPKSRSERQIIQGKKQYKGGSKLNPANYRSISLTSPDLICDEIFKMLKIYTGDQATGNKITYLSQINKSFLLGGVSNTYLNPYQKVLDQTQYINDNRYEIRPMRNQKILKKENTKQNQEEKLSNRNL